MYLNCQDTVERKMLLMYFYKEDAPVTKHFDKLLSEKPELVSMINEKFHFLAWDVSRTDLVNILEISIERNFKDRNMIKLLREGVPGLFVFMPIAECLTMFRFIPYDASSSTIVNTLEECSEYYMTELEIALHLQNNFTNNKDETKPEVVHQIMYEQMGNRDYDCFELDREDHEHYLFRKVAYAYFGPPKDETNMYDETQTSTVNDMIKVIKKQCLKYTNNPKLVVFACIYNITTPLPREKLEKCKKDEDYNPFTDFNAKPIFVVPKCADVDNACRTFIDTDLRVYINWESYLEENKLGKCLCVTPKDGRYQGDCWNRVILEYNPSPACGLGIQVLNTIDIAAMAVGVAAGVGGLVALIPAVVVAAPILVPISIVSGTAVSVYTLFRSGHSLYDRLTHKQTMSVMDGEARGAYLNIAAGALGFAGSGARFADGLTGANVLMSGAAISNSTYEVYNQWKSNNEVGYLTWIQLSSSILFFGHSVYNLQSSGTIITETQQQTLEDISTSLRSNRHRKTFNKITKETVAIHGDQQGKAKVIAYIKNLGSSRDDVLANLTKNNKMLNQKGIRYFVDEGNIQFNNIKVDISSLGKGPRHQESVNRVNLSMNGDCISISSSQKYCVIALNLFET
ncbi:PREDICTED: uncharacterized protein LOC108567883, partial [Nicrophorus vespilloides]|uniref:Uncharacterized protein LOC108567883 n=1 Tax=Nicrophorus vespilloides TaxID=110193 RepID=A0ABM1NB92_NICVS